MRRIAIVFVVLTLVLAVSLTIKIRAQASALRGSARGSGEIEGTEIALAARISARVQSIAVKEGAAVKKGDLLLTLDCLDQKAALAEAEARFGSAQAQAKAAVAVAEAAQGSKQAAQASIEATRKQAEALAVQRDAAKRQADRLESVASDVALSSRDQVSAQATSLEQQLAAAQAAATASGAQASAAAGQARAALAQAESSVAAVRAAEAGLERVRLLAEECEVKAPRDAFVETLPFEPGELVGPGSILVRLVDLSEVKAIFYLPNAEVAAVRPGAEALVEADAYPGVTFKGIVRTVALQAEFTPRNIQTRTDRDRLVYPVEVFLANPELKLRGGMPVQVTIPGTERK